MFFGEFSAVKMPSNVSFLFLLFLDSNRISVWHLRFRSRQFWFSKLYFKKSCISFGRLNIKILSIKNFASKLKRVRGWAVWPDGHNNEKMPNIIKTGPKYLQDHYLLFWRDESKEKVARKLIKEFLIDWLTTAKRKLLLSIENFQMGSHVNDRAGWLPRYLQCVHFTYLHWINRKQHLSILY